MLAEGEVVGALLVEGLGETVGKPVGAWETVGLEVIVGAALPVGRVVTASLGDVLG